MTERTFSLTERTLLLAERTIFLTERTLIRVDNKYIIYFFVKTHTNISNPYSNLDN